MPATGCLGPRGAGASPPPVNVRADNVETLEALLYPRCQGRAPPSERGPDPVRPAAKTRATTPVHAGHGLPGAQGCRSESSPCQCQSGQRRDAGGAPVSTVSGAGPTQQPDPVRPAAKTRATTPVHAGHGLPGAQGCRSESSPCQCQSGQRRDAGGAPVSTVSGAGPTQREGAGPSPPRCQNQGDHTCACRPRAAWGPGVPERVLPLSMVVMPTLRN